MLITAFKSGIWKKQYNYSSFAPVFINNEWVIDNPQLIKLLSDADIKLGELNAFSQLVPDVDFFIKMHVGKEATYSSRIEGTQTNITDAVMKEENIDPEKRDDWQEVKNYIEAMNQSIDKLKLLPLSNRMLKEAHKILMENVRGQHKTPGDFRKSQNWIGGASINDAVFIPPHESEINDLMSDLEKFLHNENIPTPDLIKIGIAHYQFETIHPFLDGNGRIGRLLITLYLVHKKILVKPTLYLSRFFEENKTLYYDNLMRVRTHNDLLQWLKFFLEGIKQISENSINTFKKIILLRDELERITIPSLGKKTKSAQAFLHLLYTQPIIDMKDVSISLNINISTAHRLIKDFVRLNILEEITGFKRNRLYVFREYINLFK